MSPMDHRIFLTMIAVTTTVAIKTVLGASPMAPCGDNPFNQDVIRDAFLLTEGESLFLSCDICGQCLRASDRACSDRMFQAWMTPNDIRKGQIRQRTKIKRPTGKEPPATKIKSLKTFYRRLKEIKKKTAEKASRAKKRILKAYLTMKRYASIAVQRFDQLQRLASESDSAVGFIKEVLKPKKEDAQLQWFVQTANGETSRVKHEALGVHLLFDLIVIRRANAANTGLYTCRWNGRVRAVFGITVVDGGVEPYREYDNSISGLRSLQPKILSKANLQVYTRWMNITRWILIPSNITVHKLTPGKAVGLNITFSWGICYVKQLDPDKPVMPENSPSLKLMPNGLPCRSHLLPVTIQSLRSVIYRPSEILKLKSTVVVDESQLHFGLNSVNYTSASPPPLQVQSSVVSRSFMVAKQGEFVSLECPLKQTVRGLIVWFKLGKGIERTEHINTTDIINGLWNPYDMREMTKDRFFTDPGGNLNMANVQHNEDQGIFYCLHSGRLVGYVYLIVHSSRESAKALYHTEVVMNVLRVVSPLAITGSIIFLTLVVSSSMFEPEVPWGT